jgi:molybdopterin-containing oxidoreductase family membrane subunit
VSIWIEKGLAMVVTGFVPSPLGRFTPYHPTMPELLISAGIYGIGAILITVFFRIFVKIKATTDQINS